MTQPPAHIGSAEDFQAALPVSRETLDRLSLYADLLKVWQRKINLVAPSTLDDVWHRHFADSAQLMRFVPENATKLLDLGSGGGFPGLVLAILGAERGAFHVDLVESDTRKAAFLREVARQTGVAVEIHVRRIEKFTTEAQSELFHVVTARALAPLSRLVGLVAPVFSPSTVALFPKGRDAEREITEARRSAEFAISLEPSLTDAAARVVVIRNLQLRTEG